MSKKIMVIGASRGIGAELVKLFAGNTNQEVFALSRNKPVMEELFKNHANVKNFAFDLERETLEDDLQSILAHLPKLDVVVFNAGKLVNKPFLELTRKEIESAYQVNVIGVMLATKVLFSHLNVGAHIVNISTMGGFQGSVKFAGLSAYSTSKAALTSFTELFSEEFKDHPVTMNCLCLGAAQTEMLAAAFPGYEAPLSAQQMATYIADFSLNAHNYIKGKVIPVSLSTP